MLTIIGNKELHALIQLSGRAIREFLSHADASKFKGEAHLAITSFQANPADFTDDKLIAYGSDTKQAINHPARIEIRGKTAHGAAQMVAKGIWGHKRSHAMAEINHQCKELGFGILLKLAGTSSIEFNVAGVDKSVAIYFLQTEFEKVLKEMDYKPGPKINSGVSKTVIAADGDGTIYDGPRVGVLPTLAESPVREPLCAYLSAGGIFMLVSGNDINRTFNRVIDALPKETYCRFLISANGGAELVYINAQGKPKPVSGYRQQALDVSHDKSHRQSLDMIYIGDDGSREGNDYPAFKAVGFQKSVLVAQEFLPEYDPGLRAGYAGGLLQGTRKSIEHFLSSRV